MGQKIGIDTPVIIYLLEKNPSHLDSARKIMRQVQSGRFQAVFSAIGLIEILTGPKKHGSYELAAQYREMIAHFPNLEIRGIDESIIDTASSLRAQYKIATPDAIHIATAVVFGAKKFITNDKALNKIKEISVELLD